VEKRLEKDYKKLKKKGESAVLADRFEEGLKFYNEALPLCESIYGIKHFEAADLYNKIGVVYLNLGKYSVCTEWLVKSRDIYIKLNETRHAGLARVYSNLGVLNRKLGNNDAALKNYLLSKEIREGNNKKHSKDIARIYLNIGNLYINKKDYDLALQWCNKAYDILKKKIFDKNKYDYASVCNSIAFIHQKTNSHESALKYYVKSIKIAESSIKTTKNLLITIYGNISGIYRDKSNFRESIKYHTKALDLFKQVYNGEHPKLADIYSEMGSTYFRQSEFDKATEYALKAAKIREKFLGKTHLLTALAYSNAGLYIIQTKNYQSGFKCYETAMSIYGKLYGEDSEEYFSACERIARTCYKAKLYEHCAEIYERVLNGRIKLQGEDNEKVASLYYNIGQCYDKIGSEYAVMWHEKCASLYADILGRNNRVTINAQTIAADICYKFEKYEQALNWYNKIFATIEINENTNFDLLLHLYLGKTAIFNKTSKTPEAIKTFRDALSVFNSFETSDKSKLTLSYNLAFACSENKDYSDALAYFESALSLIGESIEENAEIYSLICREMALIHLHIYADYSASAEYFEKSISCYKNNHADMPELAQLYKDAAFPYFKLGDYDVAQNYCYKALDILLKNYDESHEKVLEVKSILNRIFNQKNTIQFNEDERESTIIQ